MKMLKVIFSLSSFVVFLNTVSGQTSGSVTMGSGVTTIANMMPVCPSNHVTPLGTITSSDGKIWIVPSENNFITASPLFDLHNSCNNFAPTNLSSIDLSKVPVKVIDEGGDIITGFIFADNYFELFINGILVGVDPVPFTPFNSCAVKFKVSKPYTIAVRLVDWEENLGLGSEIQNAANLFHPGDGGFIAQFSDGTVTDQSWKAQSFYIAPIQNLNDVKEEADGSHSTLNASTSPTCNSQCYGIHYDISPTWNSPSFDDSNWPNATIYTAAQVTNSQAYTNFASTAWNKAKFIWSSNLILDNIVLVRKTVSAISATVDPSHGNSIAIINPVVNNIVFRSDTELNNALVTISNMEGKVVKSWYPLQIPNNEFIELEISESECRPGMYILKFYAQDYFYASKILFAK